MHKKEIRTLQLFL